MLKQQQVSYNDNTNRAIIKQIIEGVKQIKPRKRVTITSFHNIND
uniref:Uncharacterized protein n=1 Tax=Arundo donax TaxID=35708 RepID=A0A0A9AFE5_ARUDO